MSRKLVITFKFDNDGLARGKGYSIGKFPEDQYEVARHAAREVFEQGKDVPYEEIAGVHNSAKEAASSAVDTAIYIEEQSASNIYSRLKYGSIKHKNHSKVKQEMKSLLGFTGWENSIVTISQELVSYMGPDWQGTQYSYDSRGSHHRFYLPTKLRSLGKMLLRCVII